MALACVGFALLRRGIRVIFKVGLWCFIGHIGEKKGRQTSGLVIKVAASDDD